MEVTRSESKIKRFLLALNVWAKRWYTYNKQKIPMIFILIGAIFFTAFLDFDVQNTTFQDLVPDFIEKFLNGVFHYVVPDKPVKLESHIAAIRKFVDSDLNNSSALLLFSIYLVAIIQLFNAFGFAKKRSPFGLIFLTFLTLLQVAMVSLYTYIFFHEQATRTDYVIDHVARLSYSVFITGTIFFVIGTVFAWFYVNWKYVKEID